MALKQQRQSYKKIAGICEWQGSVEGVYIDCVPKPSARGPTYNKSCLSEILAISAAVENEVLIRSAEDSTAADIKYDIFNIPAVVFKASHLPDNPPLTPACLAFCKPDKLMLFSGRTPPSNKALHHPTPYLYGIEMQVDGEWNRWMYYDGTPFSDKYVVFTDHNTYLVQQNFLHLFKHMQSASDIQIDHEHRKGDAALLAHMCEKYTPETAQRVALPNLDSEQVHKLLEEFLRKKQDEGSSA